MIFFLLSVQVFSQSITKQIKHEVSILVDVNHELISKKKKRKLIHLINSEIFSDHQRLQLLSVLKNFNDRSFNLNPHCSNFFEFILQSEKNKNALDLFHQVLNYLNLQKNNLSNIELGDIFFRIDNFLFSNTLSERDGFVWKCHGGADFVFQEKSNPLLFFPHGHLVLFNDYDSVQLFDVKGYYDLIENNFSVISAYSYLSNDDVSADFFFFDFELDLNKQFFSIKNASIDCVGDMTISCKGLYKDKLSKSNNYPIFKSNVIDLEVDVFDNISIISGFELKGNSIFFSRRGRPIKISFYDEEMNYVFSAKKFELIEGQLCSSNVEFLFKNKEGSLMHPCVNLCYDAYSERITIDRVSGQRGLNPIRNNFHGLNMYVDKNGN